MYPHCPMNLARLTLKGRFGSDELTDAETDLYRGGYIEHCSQPYHEECYRITSKGERASAGVKA